MEQKLRSLLEELIKTSEKRMAPFPVSRDIFNRPEEIVEEIISFVIDKEDHDGNGDGR